MKTGEVIVVTPEIVLTVLNVIYTHGEKLRRLNDEIHKRDRFEVLYGQLKVTCFSPLCNKLENRVW